MSILLVTGIEGARNCAAVVGAQLGMEVEVAEGRKAALAALRRREFAAVVMDETMAECDPSAAEAVWERAGLAIIESDLIGVELPEGPQALLDICTALLQAEVNIVQAYPLLVRPRGRAAVALMVDNIEIAQDTLAARQFSMITEADLQAENSE